MSFQFDIIKNRKKWYALSLAVIIIGIGAGFFGGFQYGLDFTGGTMTQLDMGREVAVDEIKAVTTAHDLKADIVHAGEGNKQIIIKTTGSMDEATKTAFLNDMYQTFDLDASKVIASTEISPTIGNELKQGAVTAIIIASILMLIYIAFRFEYKFAVAAIASSVHDVLFLFAVYGLLRIQINSPFIAAILIILGYSINDTIVIFDRIRENLGIMRKSNAKDIVNLSINQTLGRSINTSFTTLLAIIALYVLGVDSIKEFTLPLIAGIIAGAYSSIFVASPIWYDLNNLLAKKKYVGK